MNLNIKPKQFDFQYNEAKLNKNDKIDQQYNLTIATNWASWYNFTHVICNNYT